jgi:chromosomal replication initiation ATPase DnaA
MTPRVRLYLRQEADKEGIEPSDILARGKRRAVTRARRQVVVRLINDGFTLTQIGRWLGNRHHSTIYHYTYGAPL